MNIPEPPEKIPKELRRWLLELRKGILTAQPKAGKYTRISEHWGKGTLVYVDRTKEGEEQPGACCHGTWPSVVCSIETPSACAALGGHFLGNETCDGIDCNIGACCTPSGGHPEFTDHCIEVEEFLCGDCAPDHSCWQGSGTVCESTRCEGSCCIACWNGVDYDCTCALGVTHEECEESAGGTCGVAWALYNYGYTCDNSDEDHCCLSFSECSSHCPPPPPPTGLCCTGSGCVDGVPEDSCPSGDFFQDLLCADWPDLCKSPCCPAGASTVVLEFPDICGCCCRSIDPVGTPCHGACTYLIGETSYCVELSQSDCEAGYVPDGRPPGTYHGACTFCVQPSACPIPFYDPCDIITP